MRRPTVPHLRDLRSFEGRRVCLALADGTRVDDCQLVSAGRPSRRGIWIFTAGADVFMPVSNVLDVWEAGIVGSAHAA